MTQSSTITGVERVPYQQLRTLPKTVFNVQKLPTDWKKYHFGPWLHEPTQVEWVSDTGLHCLIKRAVYGAWCGYVQLLFPHVNGDLDVHGGVTFDGELAGQSGRWVGFGCAHYLDRLPLVDHRLEDGVSVYRDMYYVIDETEYLAKQVFDARTPA